MQSNFDAYVAAKEERDALDEEAGAMVARLTAVAEILDRSPSVWTFERARIAPSEPRRKNEAYRIDVDTDPDNNFIDPAGWPTIEAMRDIQRRFEVASRKATEAYGKLSAAEKEYAPKLSSASPSPQSQRSR